MSDGNGELPQGWAEATIEELCDLNPKHDRNLTDETEVSFVPMAAVSDVHGTITDPQVRPYGEVRKGFTHFADGDVIFAKITPCMENGKAASVRGMTNRLACGTTEFYVFRSLGAVNQDYLFHFVRQESYRTAARAQMQSGVGQARVPKDFVLNTTLPTPPLAEQRRIVSKIESLQERSSRAREALSEVGPLLEQFRQSVLAAAFRGDLTADWREAHPDVESASSMVARIQPPPPPSRADSATENEIDGDCGLSVGPTNRPIPSTWQCTRLTRVAQLVTGHTPSRKHPEYWDGGIPWIGIKDARDRNGCVITETQQHVTELGLANSASRLLPAGTVLVTRTTNSIGYSVVLGKEMATSQDFVGWVLPKEINPQFLMYLMLAEYHGLRRFAKGSTSNPTVYFSEVLAFHVALPPTDEQNEIVARVESMLATIDQQARSAAESLSELTKLHQSILAKAFRGELVPQDPNDEPASVLLERIRREREATSVTKSNRSPRKASGRK